MATLTYSELVDEVRHLDQESKQELADLIHAWLVEERREEILRNARRADEEIASGQAKRGAVDDLMADLNAED